MILYQGDASIGALLKSGTNTRLLMLGDSILGRWRDVLFSEFKPAVMNNGPWSEMNNGIAGYACYDIGAGPGVNGNGSNGGENYRTMGTPSLIRSSGIVDYSPEAVEVKIVDTIPDVTHIEIDRLSKCYEPNNASGWVTGTMTARHAWWAGPKATEHAQMAVELSDIWDLTHTVNTSLRQASEGYITQTLTWAANATRNRVNPKALPGDTLISGLHATSAGCVMTNGNGGLTVMFAQQGGMAVNNFAPGATNAYLLNYDLWAPANLNANCLMICLGANNLSLPWVSGNLGASGTWTEATLRTIVAAFRASCGASAPVILVPPYECGGNANPANGGASTAAFDWARDSMANIANDPAVGNCLMLDMRDAAGPYRFLWGTAGGGPLAGQTAGNGGAGYLSDATHPSLTTGATFLARRTWGMVEAAAASLPTAVVFDSALDTTWKRDNFSGAALPAATDGMLLSASNAAPTEAVTLSSITFATGGLTLTINNTGTITLTGTANIWDRAFTITAGTTKLALNGSATLTAALTGALAGSGTLTLGSGGSITAITTANLIQNAGTFNAITYGGFFTFNGGTCGSSTFSTASTVIANAALNAGNTLLGSTTLNVAQTATGNTYGGSLVGRVSLATPIFSTAGASIPSGSNLSLISPVINGPLAVAGQIEISGTSSGTGTMSVNGNGVIIKIDSGNRPEFGTGTGVLRAGSSSGRISWPFQYGPETL